MNNKFTEEQFKEDLHWIGIMARGHVVKEVFEKWKDKINFPEDAEKETEGCGEGWTTRNSSGEIVDSYFCGQYGCLCAKCREDRKEVTPTISVSECCGSNYKAFSSDDGTFTNVCNKCDADCDIILKEYYKNNDD